MSEMIIEVQPVKVYYRCDNCNTGIIELVDEDKEKCDDGEIHNVYTYRCPVCGIIDQLYDIKYPYIDYVETGVLRPR